MKVRRDLVGVALCLEELLHPSHVPAVFPSVGTMDFPIPGYSRNPFVVRCVVEFRELRVKAEGAARPRWSSPLP